jgi:hypothetical protein
MFRKKNPQASIFDVGNVWPLELDPASFFGQLAAVSDRLFKDEEFAQFYKNSGRGRPCVPPSQLALILLMQNYEQISDEKTINRTAYDLQWAAVLRRHAGEKLCAKATLQTFRAQLVIHERLHWLLQKSINEAKEHGLIKGKELEVAIDTKPIVGRGAVKDTINLIAAAMLMLARAQALHDGEDLALFLTKHHFEPLLAPSIKGSVEIDWSDPVQQDAFLTQLVADARRLLELADGSIPSIKEAATLLEQILLQDVCEGPKDKDPKDKGDASGGASQDRVSRDRASIKTASIKTASIKTASIKRGTAPGRIPSATDPEQRHGRKSASKRFVGSKASIAAHVQTGLILAVEVLSGDAGDATGAVDLVEQAQINADLPITKVLADCAYGSGTTRVQFEEAGHSLIAKVPKQPNTELFSKGAFTIDLPKPGVSLEMTRVTCPAGFVSGYLDPTKDGGVVFYFDDFCSGCPLREQCTKSVHGRSVHIHAQERIIQDARAFQQTPEGHKTLRQRLIVENALARLGHLGIGQARYVGKEKTTLQLTLAAVVANFRLTWNSARSQSSHVVAAC